jgi:RNA polymerase sigma-70 factor, ECF subfamily
VATALTASLNPAGETAAKTIPAVSFVDTAFDDIVRLHQKRVYRVIFLLVKDTDAADTLTQECFLRAYQNLASFRGECRLDTWLLRIAVNLVRDHIKNRRVGFWKKLIGLDGAAEDGKIRIAAPHPSPEQMLLAREQLRAVWDAAADLSEQQRTVFMLRFAEELSLAEVAEILGLKVGSVKAQLFRATTHVRKTLKELQWR